MEMDLPDASTASFIFYKFKTSRNAYLDLLRYVFVLPFRQLKKHESRDIFLFARHKYGHKKILSFIWLWCDLKFRFVFTTNLTYVKVISQMTSNFQLMLMSRGMSFIES